MSKHGNGLCILMKKRVYQSSNHRECISLMTCLPWTNLPIHVPQGQRSPLPLLVLANVLASHTAWSVLPIQTSPPSPFGPSHPPTHTRMNPLLSTFTNLTIGSNPLDSSPIYFSTYIHPSLLPWTAHLRCTHVIHNYDTHNAPSSAPALSPACSSHAQSTKPL